MLSEAFTGEHIYSGPSPSHLLELFQPSPLPLKISRVDIISRVNGVNGENGVYFRSAHVSINKTYHITPQPPTPQSGLKMI